MTRRDHTLTFPHRASLWLAVIVLGTAAMAAQTPERFEVASVKANTGSDLSIRSAAQPPDGFSRANVPLASYVTYAFDIPQSARISGLPEWTFSTRYDVQGKAAAPITEAQRRAALRDLLATRFGLRTHVEPREQTIYVMTAARADKRLGPGVTPRPDCGNDPPCSGGGSGRPDGIRSTAVTLTRLAEGMLSNLVGQLVRDETGIPGVFDVTASWRPESAANDPNDTRPGVFTALEEQLGLKLQPARRTVDVLVIDHIERPTEN